ncbi:homoserine kinase [Brevibacillus brevis]|uniref:homoserine kinase n=1 Tax=Brevibacillus brevis TaxID=1393 RepID=UPI0020A4C8D1|nr:homoserine kinase [Brevibacillus brevis]WGV61248.1 homoserine kinase [Brevibacillus brevis]
MTMHVPVVYSTICEKALQKVLQEAYPTEQIQSVHYMLRGMNDTYLVKTMNQKRIFRLYRSDWRTEEAAVAFEMELLLHLNRQGVPVSVPIADGSGKHVLRLQAAEGNRFGALFTFAAGKEQEMDTEELSERFGRAVAELHVKAEGFSTQQAREVWDAKTLIHRPLAIIEPRLRHRKEDLQFLQRLAMELEAKLNEHIRAGLDWGICHGDLQGNFNTNFCEDNTYTHFDFDLCGYGWRAYDLAAFKLSRKLIEEDDELVESLWNAFLKGYTEVRPLSDNDQEAVSLMTGIRQLWLMGLCMHDPHIMGSSDSDDAFVSEKMEFFKKYFA